MMTSPQTKTHGMIVGEELRDEEFRAEWERLELARAVAASIVAYRSDHGLSQRDLARKLDLPQSQVARIESGTVDPTSRTLMRLAGRLGIEFTISIRPEEYQPRAGAAPDRQVYACSEAVSEGNHSAMRFVATVA